ncbi:MAG: type transport system permease protein, partial [Frankiaceae bacterium]|nr:type transport system permease protein [Frankiaceae bacterium]
MTATTMQRPVRSADPATHPAFTGIPFARLLGVEWRKATDTRAARSLLVFAALSTAGLMLIPLLSRARVDQTYGSYLFQAAIGLSILLPVVSILTLTSEWSQRTVMTTFTQEPRRLRVVSAKVVVSLLLAVGGIVYGALATVTSLAIAAASGRELTSDLNAGVIVGFIV